MRSARAALVAATAVALVACGASDQTAQTGAPAAEEERVLYAMGQGMANQFGLKGLFTEAELAAINRGFNDAVMDRSGLELDDYLQKMNDLVRQRREVQFKALQDAGPAYLAAAAAEPGARVTASGLVYIEQQAGPGARPTAQSEVTVHYTGKLTNGTVFDSSVRRGEPISFALDRVIPGWAEGLQLMQAGGKARLVLPPALAYGERGNPPAIPPDVVLEFEVELIAVK